MVNPRNCLRCRHQRCAASFPVSVSALCANQPLLFFLKKKHDSPQKCTNTSGGRAPGATGPSACWHAPKSRRVCVVIYDAACGWKCFEMRAFFLEHFPLLNVFDSSCPCERTGLPGSERHATLAHRPRVEPRTKSGRGATLQEHPTTLAIPRQQS